MMRKYPVRFGGGPGEKAEHADLARGLPYRNIQHTVLQFMLLIKMTIMIKRSQS